MAALMSSDPMGSTQYSVTAKRGWEGVWCGLGVRLDTVRDRVRVRIW
jgi:hypothetical protein